MHSRANTLTSPIHSHHRVSLGLVSLAILGAVLACSPKVTDHRRQVESGIDDRTSSDSHPADSETPDESDSSTDPTASTQAHNIVAQGGLSDPGPLQFTMTLSNESRSGARFEQGDAIRIDLEVAHGGAGLDKAFLVRVLVGTSVKTLAPVARVESTLDDIDGPLRKAQLRGPTAPASGSFVVQVIIRDRLDRRAEQSELVNADGWSIYAGRAVDSLEDLSSESKVLGQNFDGQSKQLLVSSLNQDFYLANVGIGIQRIHRKDKHRVQTVFPQRGVALDLSTRSTTLTEDPRTGTIYFSCIDPARRGVGRLCRFRPTTDSALPTVEVVAGGGSVDNVRTVSSPDMMHLTSWNHLDFDDTGRLYVSSFGNISGRSDETNSRGERGGLLIYEIRVQGDDQRLTTVRRIIGSGLSDTTPYSVQALGPEISMNEHYVTHSPFAVSRDGRTLVLASYGSQDHNVLVFQRSTPDDDFTLTAIKPLPGPHVAAEKTIMFHPHPERNAFYLAYPTGTGNFSIDRLRIDRSSDGQSSYDLARAFGVSLPTDPNCGQDGIPAAQACLAVTSGITALGAGDPSLYVLDGAVGNTGGRPVAIRRIEGPLGRETVTTLAGVTRVPAESGIDRRDIQIGAVGDLEIDNEGRMVFADAKALRVYRHAVGAPRLEHWIGSGLPGHTPTLGLGLDPKGLGLGMPYSFGNLYSLGMDPKKSALYMRINHNFYRIEEDRSGKIAVTGFGVPMDPPSGTTIEESLIPDGTAIPFVPTRGVMAVNMGFGNIEFDNRGNIFMSRGYFGRWPSISQFDPSTFVRTYIAGKDDGPQSNLSRPDGSLARDGTIQCSRSGRWVGYEDSCDNLPIRVMDNTLYFSELTRIRWIDSRGLLQTLAAEDGRLMNDLSAQAGMPNFVIDRKRLFYTGCATKQSCQLYCSWLGRQVDAPKYCRNQPLGPDPMGPIRLDALFYDGMVVAPDGQSLYVIGSQGSLILRYMAPIP